MTVWHRAGVTAARSRARRLCWARSRRSWLGLTCTGGRSPSTRWTPRLAHIPDLSPAVDATRADREFSPARRAYNFTADQANAPCCSKTEGGRPTPRRRDSRRAASRRTTSGLVGGSGTERIATGWLASVARSMTRSWGSQGSGRSSNYDPGPRRPARKYCGERGITDVKALLVDTHPVTGPPVGPWSSTARRAARCPRPDTVESGAGSSGAVVSPSMAVYFLRDSGLLTISLVQHRAGAVARGVFHAPTVQRGP